MLICPQPYGDLHIGCTDFLLDVPLVLSCYLSMFDELMKGGGVGFLVSKDNIAKCCPVARLVDLTIVFDRRSASYEALLKMGAVDRQAWEQAQLTERNDRYVCSDTREGWVLAKL